jgi:hypothetical protein
VSDQRGRLLVAALGFAGLPRPSYDRALWALRFWPDSWRGIGDVDAAWRVRASTLLAGDVLPDRDGPLAHKRDGTGWERTPWHAVQSAARDALRKASDDG